MPAAGVPDNVAVPSGFGTNVTPLGRVPLPATTALGVPEVVTVKLPGLPTANVAELALVMVGPALTTSVKFCVALGKLPFAAVKTMLGYVPAATDEVDNNAAPNELVPSVTPTGSPEALIVASGEPNVVTLNEKGEPASQVAVLLLVKLGGEGGDGMKLGSATTNETLALTPFPEARAVRSCACGGDALATQPPQVGVRGLVDKYCTPVILAV